MPEPGCCRDTSAVGMPLHGSSKSYFPLASFMGRSLVCRILPLMRPKPDHLVTSESGVILTLKRTSREKKRLFEKREYKCKNTDANDKCKNLLQIYKSLDGSSDSGREPCALPLPLPPRVPGASRGGCGRMLETSGCRTGLKAGVNELVLMGTMMARGLVRQRWSRAGAGAGAGRGFSAWAFTGEQRVKLQSNSLLQTRS